MKRFTNDAGQTVWRLESVTDFCLLPGHLFEKALKEFEFMIYSTRLFLAFDEDDELRSNLPQFIDWIEDDDCATTIKCDGDELMRAVATPHPARQCDRP